MYNKIVKLSAVFAVVALFAFTAIDSAHATIVKEAFGSEGGTVGPDGTVSCPGVPLAVCARSTAGVYPSNPIYPDHLDLFNSSGFPVAGYQGRYIMDIDISSFIFEIM